LRSNYIQIKYYIQARKTLAFVQQHAILCLLLESRVMSRIFLHVSSIFSDVLFHVVPLMIVALHILGGLKLIKMSVFCRIDCDGT